VTSALQHGDPEGTVWRPAEADTSIRPGWFHHPAEDGRVRTPEDLVDLYCRSVGRNAKLLLNVPPTPDGLLHETDVARLQGFRERLLSRFAIDVAAGKRPSWRQAGGGTTEVEIDLGGPVTVSAVRLEEDITQGQCVARHTLLGSDGGAWRVLSRGLTIGYARIERFEPTPLRRVRLTVDEAVEPPRPVRIQLYGTSS
jgi:alpha-L-fucosidase